MESNDLCSWCARTYLLQLELKPYNLAARCVNGRDLVTFKVSWQVGGRVGMVNPLEMKDTVGWGGEWKTFKICGTRDQMEVCMDDNGLLRRGQVIWLKLYHTESDETKGRDWLCVHHLIRNVRK